MKMHLTALAVLICLLGRERLRKGYVDITGSE